MAGMKMFCNVCNLTLNSPAQFSVHQTGKAHKRKEKDAASGGPSTPLSSNPVTKIVRANPIIRFVSSQGGSNTGSSETNQNVDENSKDNQTDNSTQNETSESAAAKDDAVFCSICVVKLTSKAHADMHYAGTKHKRAVALSEGKSGEDRGEGAKRKCEDMCDVCNVPLKSKAVAEAHYAGSKHGKKLKLTHNINTANPCPSFSGTTIPSQVTPCSSDDQQQKKIQAGSMFFCSFCKITVNSQEQMDAHREGGKHKSAVNGIVQQRKKTFTPRLPQDVQQHKQTPTPWKPPDVQQHKQTFTQWQPQPQDQSRFLSPSYNFQPTNFGSPNGSVPFRPAAPSPTYPTTYY